MKRIVIIGIVSVLFGLWATQAAAQTGPPGITIRHTWCGPCEVWLDEAPNGFSGVRAEFLLEFEVDPENATFEFGGTNPTDLTSHIRRMTEEFARADVADVIKPTESPVLLFTYKGPPMDLNRIYIDDDSGDVVMEFIGPENP